jgi:carboxyl-terminal processing protease
VLAVFDDGPAWHAGIQQHDTLLAVDGGPIREPSGRSRTLGPECSAVVLTVQTPGQEPRELTLIRSGVSGYLPMYPRFVPTSDGSKIGYIFLTTFLDESVPGRVRQALEDFGPLDGLIIDNRMNGGGLGSVTEGILGLFTSGHVGDFVTRESTDPLEIEADPVENSHEVPLVVLVAEDTISYGEIVSGILQDIGRARIVGQTTLGNVEQLRRYDFDDGSRAWLASSRFAPANSQADWEATGIVPDVEVIADWTSFTFETDPGVAAAIALLGHE